MIRVALVDDHGIARCGLSAYFAAQPGFAVVGEASGGEEALSKAAEWRADVIVMDILMPGGIDGIETTRRLKRASSARCTPERSSIEKDSDPERLLEAARGAVEGRAVFELSLMQRVMQAQTMRHSDVLTGREGDVLQLLAEGLTNAEIVARLFISEETVETRVANILRKLGLTHRTQAAIYAIRNGWIG